MEDYAGEADVVSEGADAGERVSTRGLPGWENGAKPWALRNN